MNSVTPIDRGGTTGAQDPRPVPVPPLATFDKCLMCDWGPPKNWAEAVAHTEQHFPGDVHDSPRRRIR